MQTIKLPLHYVDCAIKFNDKHKNLNFFSKHICKFVDIIMRIVFIYNTMKKQTSTKPENPPIPSKQ